MMVRGVVRQMYGNTRTRASHWGATWGGYAPQRWPRYRNVLPRAGHCHRATGGCKRSRSPGSLRGALVITSPRGRGVKKINFLYLYVYFLSLSLALPLHFPHTSLTFALLFILFISFVIPLFHLFCLCISSMLCGGTFRTTPKTLVSVDPGGGGTFSTTRQKMYPLAFAP